MEAKAQTRYVRVTAQKARRVVDLVRGKNAVEAISTLRFQPQAAAEDVRKLVASAVANARVKAEAAGERFDESELVITSITVDEGPTMKRIRPRAQGRANRILKRTSHMSVTVATRTGAVKEGAK
ncbi:50S ribosomal protein L22 [Demequina sp. SO4-18]|uniref:50S ribosomal protein L22 n=1 Tax=Demequina sp. SO4-18 TaxID=3401026 RepID=UPI003B59114D